MFVAHDLEADRQAVDGHQRQGEAGEAEVGRDDLVVAAAGVVVAERRRAGRRQRHEGVEAVREVGRQRAQRVAVGEQRVVALFVDGAATREQVLEPRVEAVLVIGRKGPLHFKGKDVEGIAVDDRQQFFLQRGQRAVLVRHHDLAPLRAQRIERFLHRGAGLGARLVPLRHGKQREAAGFRGRGEVGRAAQGVMAGDAAGHRRHQVRSRPHVVERRADDADVVEGRRQRMQAAGMDRIEARLEADRTGEGGGTNHAATGLGAESKRHHAGADRGAGTRRGAARRAREVERVACFVGVAGGEFRRHRLADDDGAGAAQGVHAGGIGRCLPAGVERAAHLGRQVGGPDHVLDRERTAVEQRPRVAVLVALRRRVGGRPRGGEIGRHEGVHVLVAFLDDGNAALQHVARAVGAAGEFFAGGDETGAGGRWGI